jgi:hypothetical protein
MIAYNADSPELFGSLYHYPAATYEEGTKLKVYDWDSGVYLGEIDQVTETYNVVGNTNEHGLIIGESTFGGVEALAWTQKDGMVDCKFMHTHRLAPSLIVSHPHTNPNLLRKMVLSYISRCSVPRRVGRPCISCPIS